MRGLVYCHICGKILVSDNEIYQVVEQDPYTFKSKKLYDVCKECSEKLSVKEFPLKRQTPSIRKNPKFKSIILRQVKPRKEHIIYDVLPYQFDIIKSLEVNIDDLKLVYQDGKRVYTVNQIETWINKDYHNLIDAMTLLYKYQTDDEKKNRETKYANNVGFNKPDAAFMTGMCRIYEERGYDTYTDAQLATIKKCMKKYINQIMFYINSQNIILNGI